MARFRPKGIGVHKGWDVKIVVSKLAKDGHMGIEGEILNPEGKTLEDRQKLLMGFYPVVNDRGDALATKDDIVLYSGTDILDSVYENEEQFNFDPENGIIELIYGGRLGHSEIKVDYNFKRTIGYATGISWDISTALDPQNALGSRQPVGITAGTTEITGHIDQFLVDRVLYEQACRLVSGRLVPFELEIVQSPNSPNPLTIRFTGVRFSTWNLDFSQDAPVSNGTDFTAENVNVF